MADGLSIAASIVAIIQLTEVTLDYLYSIKNAPKDREQCTMEVSNLYALFNMLKYRIEDKQDDQEWHAAVRSLAVQSGPFDQYKQALELLHSKLLAGGRLKTIGRDLVWNFTKTEVSKILERMERVKSVVQIALEMDHL